MLNKNKPLHTYSEMKTQRVHNYGAGGTGLDFAVKTLSEVYMPTSTRQLFIITVPHYFRRLWFDDNGNIIPSWQVKEKTDINEYNHYINFLHNYEILNRLIGKDKIIWGTWEQDLSRDKFDVEFECIDHTKDGLHGKGALSEAETFTILTDNEKAEIVIGYASIASNRVTIPVETTKYKMMEPISV